MGQNKCIEDHFFRNVDKGGDVIVEAIEKLQADVERIDEDIEHLGENLNIAKGDISILQRQLQETAEELRGDISALSDRVDILASGDYTFVKWHGAVGDGVTDDTAAIQAAIDSGKTYIIFDKGEYFVSCAGYGYACLYVPSNKHLFGLGATLINETLESATITNKSPAIEDPTQGGGYSANSNIIIEELNFRGKTELTNGCIGFSHCENIKIVNCKFENIRNWHFIEINSCRKVKISGCNFYDYMGSEMIQIDIANGDVGWPLFGPYDDTAPIEIVIKDCNFSNPYSYYNNSSLYLTTYPAAIGSHNLSSVQGHNPQYCEFVNNNFENINSCFKFYSLRNSIIMGNTARSVRHLFIEHLNNDTSSANHFSGIIITQNVYNADFLPDNFESANLANLPRCISFYGTNCVITNNELFGGSGHMIAVNGSGHEITGNKIDYAGRAGIYLFQCSYINVSGNNVTNSGYANTATDQDIIVRANSGIACNYCNVSGNLCGKLISENPGATKTLITSNNILTSLVSTTGDSSIIHANAVNGSWVA